MRREDVEADETIGAARAAGAANEAALGRGSARAGDIKDEAAGLAPKIGGQRQVNRYAIAGLLLSIGVI
jgi:hypothetical protein